MGWLVEGQEALRQQYPLLGPYSPLRSYAPAALTAIIDAKMISDSIAIDCRVSSCDYDAGQPRNWVIDLKNR